MNRKFKEILLLAGFVIASLPAWGYQSDEPGANANPPGSVQEGQYSAGDLGSAGQPAPAQFKPDANYGIKGDWPLYPEALAPGKGRDEVQAFCSICHSMTYITNQPPLPPQKWDETVHKMLNTFGAKQYIPKEKVSAIIVYLKAHYTPNTIGQSAAQQLASPAAAPTQSAAKSTNTKSTSAAVPAPKAASPGDSVYQQNCVTCHQASGKGIGGAFPPLAGHLPDLLAVDGGREYLAHVLLFGLQGAIEVNGKTYNGSMPAWAGSLNDMQIADVLNYALTAWDNNQQLPPAFAVYSAKEIAAERSKNLKPADVHDARGKLQPRN